MRTAAWIALAAAIVALDRITKLLATHVLEYGIPEPVFPGFNLTLIHNTGAAFSLLADAAGWQRWVFSGLAVLVSALLLGMLRRAPAGDRWLRASLMLLLGGALGNLWDRLAFGHVVDFIQVYYDRWYFPAFNIADSAISVGAVMILLHGTRFAKGRARAEE